MKKEEMVKISDNVKLEGAALEMKNIILAHYGKNSRNYSELRDVYTYRVLESFIVANADEVSEISGVMELFSKTSFLDDAELAVKNAKHQKIEKKIRETVTEISSLKNTSTSERISSSEVIAKLTELACCHEKEQNAARLVELAKSGKDVNKDETMIKSRAEIAKLETVIRTCEKTPEQNMMTWFKSFFALSIFAMIGFAILSAVLVLYFIPVLPHEYTFLTFENIRNFITLAKPSLVNTLPSP